MQDVARQMSDRLGRGALVIELLPDSEFAWTLERLSECRVKLVYHALVTGHDLKHYFIDDALVTAAQMLTGVVHCERIRRRLSAHGEHS